MSNKLKKDLKISAICAIGKNREIGYQNKLLWDLPPDLKNFRKITKDNIIIMGRKTFESIGKALPKRINIIITRDESYQAKNCSVTHSLDEALQLAQAAKEKDKKKEIFIIGGAKIYTQALPYTSKLYLTLVDDSPQADTYFPDYSEFKNVLKEENKVYNGLNYKFLELKK